MHLIEQTLMLGTGLHDIDSCRLYAGMPQDIGQLGQIFLYLVEGPGKQVPQVMGKDLLPCHIGPFAQGL